MGKKAVPQGLRIDFSGWKNSSWFADKKNYAKNVREDYIIRKIIEENIDNSLFSFVSIERVGQKTNVIINTHKPSLLVSKKVGDLDVLKNKINKKIGTQVTISVSEIYRPETDAYIVAKDIASQIEKRAHFRRAAKKAIISAMRGGAEGIRVILGGRLGGAEICRTEKFGDGSVSLGTFSKDIISANATAHTVYGTCGIKVIISKDYFKRDLKRNFDETDSSGEKTNDFRKREGRPNFEKRNFGERGGRFFGDRGQTPTPSQNNTSGGFGGNNASGSPQRRNFSNQFGGGFKNRPNFRPEINKTNNVTNNVVEGVKKGSGENIGG